MEKLSQNDGSTNLAPDKRQLTQSVWTKKSLIARLKKGREARAKFVESQVINEVVFQIRALRHKNKWSQPNLAEKIGTTQNQIYRLENTQTTKPTLTTLKKLAAAFDVGLVVRFVPFGEMVDYLSGTPRLDRGISTASKRPLSFGEELASLESQEAGILSPTNQLITNLTPTIEEWPLTFEEAPLYLRVAGQTLAQHKLTAAGYTSFVTGAYEWWAQPNAAVPVQSYTQYAEPSQEKRITPKVIEFHKAA